jgi:Holliday junction resolvase-like predicted endonuclease
MNPGISKSTRHSKITGDFGEALVLYWLSKHGFECAQVDHTGIDLIARNPHTDELMGISVKCSSREMGREEASLRIDADHFAKVAQACVAFGCVPYYAIVIDAIAFIRCFITPMEHVRALFGTGGGGANWKVRTGPGHLDRLMSDPEVMIFGFQSETVRWWSSADR